MDLFYVIYGTLEDRLEQESLLKYSDKLNKEVVDYFHESIYKAFYPNQRSLNDSLASVTQFLLFYDSVLSCNIIMRAKNRFTREYCRIEYYFAEQNDFNGKQINSFFSLPSFKHFTKEDRILESVNLKDNIESSETDICVPFIKKALKKELLEIRIGENQSDTDSGNIEKNLEIKKWLCALDHLPELYKKYIGIGINIPSNVDVYKSKVHVLIGPLAEKSTQVDDNFLKTKKANKLSSTDIIVEYLIDETKAKNDRFRGDELKIQELDIKKDGRDILYELINWHYLYATLALFSKDIITARDIDQADINTRISKYLSDFRQCDNSKIKDNIVQILLYIIRINDRKECEKFWENFEITRKEEIYFNEDVRVAVAHYIHKLNINSYDDLEREKFLKKIPDETYGNQYKKIFFEKFYQHAQTVVEESNYEGILNKLRLSDDDLKYEFSQKPSIRYYLLKRIKDESQKLQLENKKISELEILSAYKVYKKYFNDPAICSYISAMIPYQSGGTIETLQEKLLSSLSMQSSPSKEQTESDQKEIKEGIIAPAKEKVKLSLNSKWQANILERENIQRERIALINSKFIKSFQLGVLGFMKIQIPIILVIGIVLGGLIQSQIFTQNATIMPKPKQSNSQELSTANSKVEANPTELLPKFSLEPDWNSILSNRDVGMINRAKVDGRYLPFTLKNRGISEIVDTIMNKNPTEIKLYYDTIHQKYGLLLFSLNIECFKKQADTIICICDTLKHIPCRVDNR